MRTYLVKIWFIRHCNHGWHIRWTKRHDTEMKVVVVSFKRSLLLVALPHADLMVALSQVQLGEVSSNG